MSDSYLVAKIGEPERWWNTDPALTNQPVQEVIMADAHSKACSFCKQSKPLSEFHKNKASKDGVCSLCKLCACARTKEHTAARNADELAAARSKSYLENRDSALARSHAYRLKNIESIREYDRIRAKKRTKEVVSQYYRNRAEAAKKNAAKWASANRDKKNFYAKAWRQRNKSRVNAWDAARYANEKLAMPSWANQFFIEEAYALAKLRERLCGGRWHVDHIVPLQSKLVCGLHVESNLQVIPAAHNIRKSNRYWPDMP